MPSLSQLDLQGRLAALIAENEVPGASVAVLFGDDLVEAAAGTLNVNTGVEVGTDTIFQIGSITKIYTATLVMQLVDDGMIALDVPVTRYLPEGGRSCLHHAVCLAGRTAGGGACRNRRSRTGS